MKTLFAFLGLFMFASVSSTDLTESTLTSNEPQLMETGEYSTSPAKKRDLVMTTETGEYSTSPAKKRDLPRVSESTSETGEYSTSPAKKRDLVMVTETGEYSTSPAKKRDLV
jgi:hypothetical protein